MKIAIVGAGFAGLAAAYYLSEHHTITIFDRKGVGSGASGSATGLCHPYPGEKGRRSWKAEEALSATRELIAVAEKEMGVPVAAFSGIERRGACVGAGSDVVALGQDHYLIESGFTIFVPLYLEGLRRACERRGVTFIFSQIEELESLSNFDQIVIAAGAQVKQFKECAGLNIGFVKGQALVCKIETPLKRSVSSKTYLAVTENPHICHSGATYEREFTDDLPCLEKAQAQLKAPGEVLECRAGVRVTNPAHYFPILEQVQEKIWVITALGSRGLLYHAYLGKQLEQQWKESFSF